MKPEITVRNCTVRMERQAPLNRGLVSNFSKAIFQFEIRTNCEHEVVCAKLLAEFLSSLWINIIEYSRDDTVRYRLVWQSIGRYRSHWYTCSYCSFLTRIALSILQLFSILLVALFVSYIFQLQTQIDICFSLIRLCWPERTQQIREEESNIRQVYQ